ncbi:MAG TPA: hypothetical protein PLP28_01750, partial [Flavobacteriales bacterium]|nr:hypothetical protein [Flavobacteriales bacterium]
MNDPRQQLEHLAEMRSLMERSTRFLSLSGLSGVWAGACALVGAFFVRNYLETELRNRESWIYYELKSAAVPPGLRYEFVLLLAATAVLTAALIGGLFF